MLAILRIKIRREKQFSNFFFTIWKLWHQKNLKISWVSEWWICVLNLTPFASILSTKLLNTDPIRIRIHNTDLNYLLTWIVYGHWTGSDRCDRSLPAAAGLLLQHQLHHGCHHRLEPLSRLLFLSYKNTPLELLPVFKLCSRPWELEF